MTSNQNFEMFEEVVHNFGKSEGDIIYFNMKHMWFHAQLKPVYNLKSVMNNISFLPTYEEVPNSYQKFFHSFRISYLITSNINPGIISTGLL